MKFYESEPYLEFKDRYLILPEDLSLAKIYIELMRYRVNNIDYISSLEVNINRYEKNISNLLKMIDKELAIYNITPIETYNIKKKLNNNYKKLVFAYQIILDIRNVFNDIGLVVNDYVNIRLKNREDIKRIEDIGIDANKNV